MDSFQIGGWIVGSVTWYYKGVIIDEKQAILHIYMQNAAYLGFLSFGTLNLSR